MLHPLLEERAAREKAKWVKRTAACLDYPEISVNSLGETHPKQFIRQQFARKLDDRR